jgi:hypothetical protein
MERAGKKHTSKNGLEERTRGGRDGTSRNFTLDFLPKSSAKGCENHQNSIKNCFNLRVFKNIL